jgi:serine/threonine protein kinase
VVLAGALFLNEARAAIIAEHPGLVKVFDSGQLADGTLYLLMEFLQGETVAARLRSHSDQPIALPESVTLRLGRQIASALAVVHARGIAHRDMNARRENRQSFPAALGSEGSRWKGSAKRGASSGWAACLQRNRICPSRHPICV